MNIKDILKPLNRDQLETLSKRDLITLFLGEQDLREQAESWAKTLEDETYRLGELYIRIRNRIFDKKSEKSSKRSPKPRKNPKKADKRTLKPSERYPDATIVEQEVELDPVPPCKACGHELEDSGMTETTEVLSVVPKQYIIKRQHYHKYRCSHCHGDIQTTPAIPRIKPGSGYDDAMIIDVAMAKYCDLIPVERYAQMAKRSGFPGLPPHSLIELTHYLADFLDGTYRLIKDEVLATKVLFADETPHRMLEGDAKSTWYLWGFSSDKASYFECHDTRSGDVASEILLSAKCLFLVSDVYSGYNKATNACNKIRIERGIEPLQNIYCNAHARRKFKEVSIETEVSTYFVEKYREIYRIEAEVKNCDPEKKQEARTSLKPIFNEMRIAGENFLSQVSSKSQEAQAINYFLKNFNGLTKFLDHYTLPIDNNHQERMLRNPVIGRKTWFGTHSRRGAETAAKLFTIVESCKLNNLNPRQYLEVLVKDIHQKKPPTTPMQMAAKSEIETQTG